jgi:hypothetical protein
VAESFFATLEHELLADAASASREAARRATVEFIVVRYNGERRHSSLGYLSPVQYEQRLRQAARQVTAAYTTRPSKRGSSAPPLARSGQRPHAERQWG